MIGNRLVTRPPRLGNDVSHVVDLSLCAAECTKLVACQYAIRNHSLPDCIKRPALYRGWEVRTRRFASLRARLSLLLRSNSMIRRSYGARPDTSLTISRTKAVRLLRWPFMRETRALGWRGVTCCFCVLVYVRFFHISFVLVDRSSSRCW